VNLIAAWRPPHANRQAAARRTGGIRKTGHRAGLDLPESGECTLANTFGDSLHQTATVLHQVLAVPWRETRRRFGEQCRRACCSIEDLDGSSGDDGRLYRISHKLLLSHEDKTYPGSLIASASIPWGEVRSWEGRDYSVQVG